MDDFQIVYPPNKPMERRFYVPAPHDKPKQAMFVDVNEKGQVIIGSSDFLSSTWTGCLFFYGNVEDAQDNVVAKKYRDETTVSIGKYIDEDKIILANDGGKLTVLCLSDVSEENNLFSKDVFCNSTRILGLDLWKSSKKLVTCNEDEIMLWETNGGLSPLGVYRNYHTDIITSVCCKSDENQFLSSSWDRRVCLWDIRNDTPANVINDMNTGPVTAITVNREDENYIVIGTADGLLGTIDVRKPKEFVDKSKTYASKIHRLLSHKTRASVAVAADSNKLKVFETCRGDLKLTFESDMHSNMVRDFSWNGDDLLSCGLDGKLIKHICV